MIELFVLAALGFTALIVIGALVSVFSLVGWFLWLPFKIIGWLFRGVALLIALPFVLLAVVLGGFGMLLGVGVLFLPLLLPFAMIGGFLWWLFRRPAPTQARTF